MKGVKKMTISRNMNENTIKLKACLADELISVKSVTRAGKNFRIIVYNLIQFDLAA